MEPLTLEQKEKIRQIIYKYNCTPEEMSRISSDNNYALELINKEDANLAKEAQAAEIRRTKEPLFSRESAPSIRFPRINMREN